MPMSTGHEFKRRPLSRAGFPNYNQKWNRQGSEFSKGQIARKKIHKTADDIRMGEILIG